MKLKKRTKSLLKYGLIGRYLIEEHIRKHQRVPLATPLQVVRNVADEALDKIENVLDRIETKHWGDDDLVPFDDDDLDTLEPESETAETAREGL
jgi:hypothetical protein